MRGCTGNLMKNASSTGQARHAQNPVPLAPCTQPSRVRISVRLTPRGSNTENTQHTSLDEWNPVKPININPYNLYDCLNKPPRISNLQHMFNQLNNWLETPHFTKTRLNMMIDSRHLYPLLCIGLAMSLGWKPWAMSGSPVPPCPRGFRCGGRAATVGSWSLGRVAQPPLVAVGRTGSEAKTTRCWCLFPRDLSSADQMLQKAACSWLTKTPRVTGISWVGGENLTNGSKSYRNQTVLYMLLVSYY